MENKEYKKSNQAYLKIPKNAGKPVYDRETGVVKILKDGSPQRNPQYAIELNIVEALPIGKYEVSIYEREGQFGKYFAGKIVTKKELIKDYNNKNSYSKLVSNNSFMSHQSGVKFHSAIDQSKEVDEDDEVPF